MFEFFLSGLKYVRKELTVDVQIICIFGFYFLFFFWGGEVFLHLNKLTLAPFLRPKCFSGLVWSYEGLNVRKLNFKFVKKYFGRKEK